MARVVWQSLVVSGDIVPHGQSRPSVNSCNPARNIDGLTPRLLLAAYPPVSVHSWIWRLLVVRLFSWHRP